MFTTLELINNSYLINATGEPYDSPEQLHADLLEVNQIIPEDHKFIYWYAYDSFIIHYQYGKLVAFILIYENGLEVRVMTRVSEDFNLNKTLKYFNHCYF